MLNRSMEKKIREGECRDISGARRHGPHYILDRFEDGMDYCDAKLEQWVWSIGKRRSDGVILASTSQQCEFYMNPDFECLFLR